MSSQAIRMSQLDNFLNNSNNNFQKKNFSYSNLFRDNIMSKNLSRANNSYSHLLNHTFNKSFNIIQKKKFIF
jgi:hypothetical protein